jgi:prepilin-type N-terminal cleavage/methylation domain-containing protein
MKTTLLKTASLKAASSRRAGFSLVELMAVLVILAILLVFLIPRLGGMGENVKANTTRAFLEGQLATAIAEYEHEFGDYPPSSWRDEWGAKPNDVNLGSELLFISMWSEKFSGLGMDEERLENTDGDELKKKVTTLGSSGLFEICDEWGNPIAYFHHRDYGREDVYQSFDNETGEEVESKVKSLDNALTKSPYNPRSFQLISPGMDGIFGTEDDVTNFKRK